MSDKKLALIAIASICALVAAWLGFASRSRSASSDAHAVAGSRDESSPASRELLAPIGGSSAGVRTPTLDASDSAAPSDRAESTSTGTVRGHVVDARGAPVASAEIDVAFHPARGIDVLDADYARALEHIGSTRSDAAGSFEIAVPRARVLDVIARAAGCAPARAEGAAGDDLTLRVTAAARIAGNVRTRGEGNPLANVALVLRDRETLAELGRARTDANGAFAIERLNAGVVTLHAIAAAAAIPAPALLELTAGTTTVHDVELDPGVTITGRVVDAASKRPLAGAQVATDWLSGKSVSADASGAYTLKGFAGKRVHARAVGYCGAVRRLDASPAADRVIDFELARGREVAGRVVGDDGRPIADAYVALVSDNAGPEHTSQDWRSGRTDANGKFAVGGLDRDGDHALLVQHPGRATLAYDLPPSEHESDSIELGDIVMCAAGSIAGSVREKSGAPLADVRLRLSGANADRGSYWAASTPSHATPLVARRDARSDAHGRFFFADLSAGRYELEATLAVGKEAQASEIDVLAGPAVTSVDVVLEVGDTIEGRVESPEGSGLSDVVVRAMPDGDASGDPEATLVIATGADGRFLLRGLEGERYQLIADPAHRNRLVDERYVRAALPSVAAGERAVRIVLPHAALVSGRIVSAANEPVRDARVSAYVDGAVVDTATSDAAGAFKLAVARGTRCRVAAEWVNVVGEAKDIRRGAIDEVDAGRTDLVVRLAP